MNRSDRALLESATEEIAFEKQSREDFDEPVTVGSLQMILREAEELKVLGLVGVYDRSRAIASKFLLNALALSVDSSASALSKGMHATVSDSLSKCDELFIVPVSADTLDNGLIKELELFFNAQQERDVADRVQIASFGCRQLYKSCMSQISLRLPESLIDTGMMHRLNSEERETLSDQQIVEAYLSFDLPSESDGKLHCIPSVVTHRGKALGIASAAVSIYTTILSGLGRRSVLDLIEMPLVRVLGDMELEGIPVNASKLNRVRDLLNRKCDHVLQFLVKASGKSDFNPLSKQQCMLAVTTLGVKSSLSSSSNSFSDDQISFIMRNPKESDSVRTFASRLKKYRHYRYALQSGVQTILNHVDAHSIVRPTFKQDGSLSGRIYTSAPNLQGIPSVRSLSGKLIRSCIEAPPGFVILCADYSQIELVIAISMSGDAKLCDAIRNGEDIHTRVAHELCGAESLEKVGQELRTIAKQLNFGLIYGMGVETTQKRLDISKEKAQELIEMHQLKFSALHELRERLIRDAKSNEFAQTLFGRRQDLSEGLNSSKRSERAAAERIAVNMPIQGTQADLIKAAMVNIHRQLELNDFQSRLILQVHDELVLLVAEQELDHVRDLVSREMCHALPLESDIVPGVKVGVGSSWFEAASRSSTYSQASTESQQ